MMGLLGGNVTLYVLQPGIAHRERAVSRLPSEVFPCRELLVHPTKELVFNNRRRRPDNLADRSGGRFLVEKVTCTSREANVCGIFFRPYPGLPENPRRSPRLAPNKR